MLFNLSTQAEAQSWYRWIAGGVPNTPVGGANWQLANTDVAGANPYFCLPAWNGTNNPFPTPTYYIGFTTGGLGEVSCLAPQVARNIQILNQGALPTQGSSFIIQVRPLYTQIDRAGEQSAIQMGRLTVNYTAGVPPAPCQAASSVVEFRYALIPGSGISTLGTLSRGYEGPACVVRNRAPGASNLFSYSVAPELGSQLAIQQAGADRYRWFVDPTPTSSFVPLNPTVLGPGTTNPLLAPIRQGVNQDGFSNSIVLDLSNVTLPIRLGVVPGWCQNNDQDFWRLRNRNTNDFWIDELPEVIPDNAVFETTFLDEMVTPAVTGQTWARVNLTPGASSSRICMPPTVFTYRRPGTGGAAGQWLTPVSTTQSPTVTLWVRMAAQGTDYQYSIASFEGGLVAPTIVAPSGFAPGGNVFSVVVPAAVQKFAITVRRQNRCGTATHTINVDKTLTLANGAFAIGPQQTVFDNRGGWQGSNYGFGVIQPVGGSPFVDGFSSCLAPVFMRPDGLSRHRYELQTPGTGQRYAEDLTTTWRFDVFNQQGVALMSIPEANASAFGITIAAPTGDLTRRNNTREVVYPRSLRAALGQPLAHRIVLVCTTPNGCLDGPAHSMLIPSETLPNQTIPFSVDGSAQARFEVGPIDGGGLVSGSSISTNAVRYSWYVLNGNSRTFSVNRNALNPAAGNALWGFASPDYTSDATGSQRQGSTVTGVNKVQTSNLPTTAPGSNIVATAEPASGSTTTPCFFWAGEAISSVRRRPNDPQRPEVAYKAVQADLRVVPNPAKGKVSVQRLLKHSTDVGRAAFQVVLVNSSGTQLGATSFKTETGEVDLTGLAPGSYKVVDLGTGAAANLIIE